jgi:bla regulator protein BlaR1
MEIYLNEMVRYLAAQSWQIAVLTVVVAAAAFALRRRSAHVRYLLWLIVVAKCLVPPLHVVPLRVLPQTVPDRIPFVLSQPASSGARPAFSHPASLGSPSPQLAESAPSPVVPQPSGPRRSVSGWLEDLWLFGAGAYVTMNLLRALRGHYWLRKSRKPLPGDMQVDPTDMLPAFGIRRLPRIWIVEGVGQPFVWGLVRGSIYVPPGFLTIASPEHRRNILAHELSHIVRFDAAVNSLQVIAQAVFWFHPFVWWANRRIRVEREKCCDETVIARLHTPAKDYCNAVVETLANMKKSTRPVPSLAVAGPVKNIEERIRAMLRPGRVFYKRPSLVAVTIVLLLALLTVPTALALTVAAESKAAPQVEKKPAPSLHHAARDGDLEQVKKLIAQGADVKARDMWGRTALHFAAYRSRTEVAQLLLRQGAYVDATDNEFRATPLHCAAMHGNPQTVELLLSTGANANAKN